MNQDMLRLVMVRIGLTHDSFYCIVFLKSVIVISYILNIFL